MSLKEYVRKRNFRITSEPRAIREKRSRHRFVIQKHEAQRLHYDFRLELDGTLKSWAVPKGIPFRKGEKRLAIQVEDHPLSYRTFEGTIPQGQYGGGTVMVWDEGTYEPLSPAPRRELEAGKLHFTLNGKKLQGEWYLIRLREENQWLLIKAGDGMKPVSKKQDDLSARSGKTMRELATDGHSWTSKPRRSPSKTASSPSRLPPFIEPMKALLVDRPPPGSWLYELKFDGFRALGLRAGSQTALLSRNQKDLGIQFPEVLESLRQLEVRNVAIDGEIVALDPQGRSSFQLLQAHISGEKHSHLAYYAFDLLYLEGRDLRDRPLTERKEKLSKLFRSPPGVLRLSDALGNDATLLLRRARSLGLEGLIGKRADSLYESGRRSGAWIKLKLHHEQEFVIGGFTPPEGSRRHLGALLIGIYEDGELLFSGKVGTGFTHATLKSLHARLKKILRSTCPFSNLPEKKRARYGQAITPAEMKRCQWVQPKWVCQLRFAEWTRDGKLRQPVFLGLRPDKEPFQVVREKSASSHGKKNTD
jgi:bifunctional non-homologous end joining protein LigD